MHINICTAFFFPWLYWKIKVYSDVGITMRCCLQYITGGRQSCTFWEFYLNETAEKLALLIYLPVSSCFLSQAVTRITKRDGVSSEDALRRLQSQWSNAKQVEHANVVLSTLWEPEVTRKQVTHSSRRHYGVYPCALHLSKIRKLYFCDNYPHVFNFKGTESLESSSEENPAEARGTVGTRVGHYTISAVTGARRTSMCAGLACNNDCSTWVNTALGRSESGHCAIAAISRLQQTQQASLTKTECLIELSTGF